MYTVKFPGGYANVDIEDRIATARFTPKDTDPAHLRLPFEISFDIADPAQCYVVTRGVRPERIRDGDIRAVITTVVASMSDKV